MNDLFANDYDLSHLEKITTKRYDFNLFVTPRFKYHYVDMVYEETTALLMRQNAKGVNTFIDVGAHYGFFDVLIGLSNPQCKILAFEPVPENCEILQKNLALNNVDASAYRFAVSDRPGHANFQISEASDNSGFIANPAAGIARNIETGVVQLDQYLSEILNGPVLIKIDTEGNEIKVLDGMQKIIEKCSDLRLVIEFNPKCLEANGASPQTLLNRIFELGFDTFFIHDEERRYEKYHQGQEWRDFMGEGTYRNLYCAKRNRTKNVLIFSHSSLLAGSERSMLELVKELTSDYGTICTVVLPSPGPLEGLLQQAGAATLIAPLNWWCAVTEPPDNAKIRQLSSQSFGWLNKNLQIFRQINPDVVLTNTLVIPWGAVAASLLKRPHVWMINEFGELDHRLKFFLPFPQILGFIDESSDKIVTCSKAIQKELFPHLDSNKIKTIYYSIDIPDKKSIAEVPKDSFFLIPDACHLIISGTVMKSKGQEDAVRAVIELIKNRKRKVELVIAGYAQLDFQSYLQEIINAEGVNDYIHIVPFQENVISIVNSADIVLVCSRMEGFGRVTLEAMLMEKAVIATNMGGTKEMVFDGETGLLYTPGNYTQLAGQIEKLLDDPNERLNLAHNAYRFAKKTFTKKKFGGGYHKMLVDFKNKEYQNKEEMSWFITNQYQMLLEQKEQSVQALTLQVAEKEQIVQALTAQAAEKMQALQAQLAERDAQVKALSIQLREITISKAWRVAVLLRCIRVWLAPPNSRSTRASRFFIGPLVKIRTSWRLKKDLALIRSSVLFDEPWYLANNPDVAGAEIDPALHYLQYGALEGRDPGPDFCSKWYMDTYTDVKENGINPLVHYLEYGKNEGRPASSPAMVERPEAESTGVQSTPPSARKSIAVCTIASKNYLSMVRIFAESVTRENPDIRVYVLLVDHVENKFDPAEEPYHLIAINQLDNIPNPEHMLFKYDPIELNTAVKPYFLEYLFREFHLNKICYFDPDIYVFSKLDWIWDLLENHALVLTPHITTPYQDNRHPNELEINLAGVFNLGFIGLSDKPATTSFLKWWQLRLYDYCFLKPSQGMHVDQNWLNFAPVMHDGVFILRDPAYNIAYWNLHERGRLLSFRNGSLCIDDRPAVFFHFSGFDPKDINGISKHQDRFVLSDFPNLRPLFEFYQDLLQQAAYEKIKQWPYFFGRFDNGVRIPQLARAMYSRLSKEQTEKFGNPFNSAGSLTFFGWMNQPAEGTVENGPPFITRLHMEIHNLRPDLQRAFPDSLGADRMQYWDWIQASAARDFDLDNIFLDPAAPQIDIQARRSVPLITRFRRGIQGLMLSSRQLIKEPVKRTLRSNDRLLQTFRKLDEKYIQSATQVMLRPVSSSTRRDIPFGVNVAGYIQGEFGVAEVARTSLKALKIAGVPYVLNNVHISMHRHEDHTFEEFSNENPYRINLVHVNADQVSEFVRQKGEAYLQGRYNIGYWFWELPHFPKKLSSSFSQFQEIWVASSFCQESIASESPIPVVKMTFPILVDKDQAVPNRQIFDLPEERFIFGFFFDYLSVFERKNPLALIKAFRMAFQQNSDALLVIKMINAEHAPQEADALRSSAEGGGVRFVDGHLSRYEVTSLMSSLDCFVSLHRSEGFGIGMAQAMCLGKPVIATGYSGNMEFMNHNNSFLVRYKLTELKEDYGPYQSGNIWADPDLEHAAELMKLVYYDRTLSGKIAQRAEADMRSRMSAEMAGEEMKSRLLLVAA